MNATHIDKIGLAMTSQSKHKTDPNAENKRLFAIDCLHSNTPGIYWQCKMKNWKDSWGNFRAHETPSWMVDIDYRRDPEAPECKKQTDIIYCLSEFMRPKTKYGHIKRGDKVLVSDGNKKPFIRAYFAEEIYGNAYCYPGGLSDFTYYKRGVIGLSAWDNCELWDGING